MGVRPLSCLQAFLLALLLCCCGTEQKAEANGAEQDSLYDMPARDVTTPLATVPVVNPSNPAAATPATPMPPLPATPSLATPAAGGGGGGRSWCIASQSASPTALQVALDYACGYGGADCSAIQAGASCFNPDTVRDHASYAFNSYYQKNPVPTSCDFGGTAVPTSVDPSTSTCQYPSTSTGASVLNTTTPAAPATGPPVYGTSPPAYGSTSPPLYGSMSPPDYSDNTSDATVRDTRITVSFVCLVIATTISL